MNKILIAMIAAQGENREIGLNNQLLWHISDDLKYFKRTTMGKPVVMGRKTYESIGRPLPGRKNIVISRSGFEAEGIFVCSSLDEAVDLAKEAACESGAEEVVIMGGAQIYELMLPRTDVLYLTEVHKAYEADSFFPAFDRSEWIEEWQEAHLDYDPPYTYLRLVRKD